MSLNPMLLAAALCAGGCFAQEVPHSHNFNELWNSAELHRRAGESQEALRDYREAAGSALNLENAAKAYFRMGQIFEQLKDTDAALSCYQSSLERFTDPDTQGAIVRLQKDRMGRLVGSSEIVRSLRRAATRSQVVTLSIDLYVNFDFDKDTLAVKDTPAASNLPAQVAGITQVEQLAKALADPELAHDRFEIDGHTDLKGNDQYNLDLSLRRAQRVRDALITKFKLDPSRLEIKGFGSQQPLQADQSEAAGRLNRRVSVKRLQGSDYRE
jgi:outer membrane protein OmpA-like peptidoglycan-associated protein